MPDLEKLAKSLERWGVTLRVFPTAAQAADYLCDQIHGESVAFGGSMTLKALDLYPRLSQDNQVFWHWEGGDLKQAMSTQVYLSSVNALAETGEIVNMDGVGNRVASTIYGHQRVYFVAGINKVVPDLESAIWRTRNIASPKNAQRLGRKTPCAVKGDRCYDCRSPERVCRALTILYGPTQGMAHMEVVLVEEELGL